MAMIAGFGNPLLDITVRITDKTLLQKYNLNEDDQKEIPKDQITSLMHDISKLTPQFSPGGATQNTLRILQWVLEKPHSTVMFGAVGNDAQGETLKNLVEACGVKTRYIEHKEEPTGLVIALVSGSNRSLAAYIGAAHHVAVDDIQADHNNNILKTVNLIYMEGFFLPKRQLVAKYVQQYCENKNKIFAFNLSAVYMIKTFPEDILHYAEKCDILIGNKNEFEALIHAQKLPLDPEAFIVKLSKDYDNAKNLKYSKIVIMTNSAKSVVCAHSSGKLEEISVPKIDVSKIGDTTGAGDAFAAGFLAGMLAGHTPITCLKWGCWVAQQIIQQTGCTIPNFTADFLKSIV